MMAPRVYKAEGIILKRKNVGEADRIITIFTKEYGKVRVIAKGIRKVASRRAPHLEVFTRVYVVIHTSKSLESVSEVQPIEVYGYMRSDIARVSMAYYLCELIDSLLPEKQEHRDVFILLTRALNDLGKGTVASIYGVSKIFTLELLWTLGFLPRNKSFTGDKLQKFIETITEKRMKSTHFARQLMGLSHA
ncbi:MAG: DNA repair protein RecO [Patescibacteria group bacterium]